MPVLQQITIPLLSVNDTSLTVVAILFTQGAAIIKDDILLVLETSKTTYDVVAEVDGFIGYTCDENEDYAINEIVGCIYSDSTEVPVEHSKSKKNKQLAAKPTTLGNTGNTFTGETVFSEAAIALIEANSISKESFIGVDFVSKTIVEEMLGIKKQPAGKLTTGISLLIPVDTTKVVVEKISSNKKREIAFLSTVQSTGLTSTIHTQVATAGIFVHINTTLTYLKNSLLPVIIYETGRLLLKYPLLNGYFTDDAIALYKEVNIGFAIDIDKGLKVVKIPSASTQSVTQIEEGIMLLSNKYMDDSLLLDDLTDIGFTITDLAAEGVSFFKPLVNNMNSAILGISAIDEKLQRCTLSLTFDHRVTEGKTAAGFLQELKLRLQSYQSKYHPNLNQNIACFKCFKQLKDDLADVGFSKCITPKGEEAYICQSCFKGF